MKSIIVGYSDRVALGVAQIICGLDATAAEQAAVMHDAKRLHKFPTGTARLEQYVFNEPIDTAIFISAETAKACQDIDAGRKRTERAQREKFAAQQKSEAALVSANKAVTAAAQKRNRAIADIATQRNLLANNPGDKQRADIVAKIEKLQPLVEASIAEFKAVLELRDIIKNPKSPAEDIAAAAKLIADPAKAAELKAKVEADAAKAAIPPVISETDTPPPAS